MNPLLSVNNTSEESFENKLLNPSIFNKSWMMKVNDPDLIFFNDYSEAVSSPYYSIDEYSCASTSLLKNSFSILQINIRSMNKNFEILHEYLNIDKGKYSIIALTETWYNDNRADENSA